MPLTHHAPTEVQQRRTHAGAQDDSVDEQPDALQKRGSGLETLAGAASSTSQALRSVDNAVKDVVGRDGNAAALGNQVTTSGTQSAGSSRQGADWLGLSLAPPLASESEYCRPRKTKTRIVKPQG